MNKRGILILITICVLISSSLPLRVLSYPARAAGAAPDAGHVTKMVILAVPSEYKGPCPHTIRFIGEIAFDGPGKMVYNIDRSDGAKLSEGRQLSFAGAGTKKVEYEWAIGKSLMGWVELDSGNMRSNKAEFKVDCTL